ncbi:PhoP regulatory network protein domain-containing protein [Desulfonema limicola]|uniref:PhoP regulatory network protein domain-containing protein n=1 Tax=Desulfonema limicola TaxID=45656 RepID=A0A975B7G2_9BACT|nr:YrbL family protein [Desulfonema limicola]QTA80184.1 PhoP regulatory network protein domain-containing protein [Desulfonema limicola]
MIIINSKPIGKGIERECYIHPMESNKIIKISSLAPNIQSKREISYYKKLQKRKKMKWNHIPKFYGEVSTNLGAGFITELILDFDGKISKHFSLYIKQNGISVYSKQLEELKNYFINEKVIFNYDMSPKNLLLRRTNESESELVLIDGLGDIVFIEMLNYFKYFLKNKILRRWSRFEQNMYLDYG